MHNSGVSSWQNTGGTLTKDGKRNKCSDGDVSNFSESDSEFDPDVESEGSDEKWDERNEKRNKQNWRKAKKKKR